MCDILEKKLEWYTVLSNQNLYSVDKIEQEFDYVRLHFMDLIQNSEIFQLDQQTFKTIIIADNLNIQNEDFVFESIKMWFKSRYMDIDYNLYLLLDAVRLPLVSSKYLLDEVEKYTCLNSECRSLFLEALRYHLLPDERSNIPANRTKRRIISKKILSVGSWDMPTSTVIELYDTAKNSWTFLKDFGLQKRNSGFAIINNELMIIGGYNGTSLDSVETVDLETGKISTAAPLKEARHNSGIVVLGQGKSAVIYAIGGWGPKLNTKSVERWDQISRDWTFVESMLTIRDGCGATVLDNKIYVAGGRDGSIYHKSMEMYDPIVKKWKFKGAMNQIRSYCRIVAAGNFIYAIGGHGGSFGTNILNHVEKYNPSNDSWTTIASVTSAGVIGVGSLQNRVIIAGGSGASKIVEEYDPETNTWRKLSPLNRGREGTTIVEIPWKLYDNKFNWK